MPYAPLLSDEEVVSALTQVPEWTREGEAILRTIRCPSFREAIALVVSVADAAEAADHHPDMLIRWRRVAFTLSTNASGGLTAKNFALPAAIDRLAARIGAA